jgi:ATP/maltotriose-dependent transcriptional regulator MalT
MADHLSQAKLYIPQSRPKLVPRPRLTERLRASLLQAPQLPPVQALLTPLLNEIAALSGTLALVLAERATHQITL